MNRGGSTNDTEAKATGLEEQEICAAAQRQDDGRHTPRRRPDPAEGP